MMSVALLDLPFSKSRVNAGLQCHKLLWWMVHEPEASELELDERPAAVMDQGERVDSARSLRLTATGSVRASRRIRRGLGAMLLRADFHTRDQSMPYLSDSLRVTSKSRPRPRSDAPLCPRGRSQPVHLAEPVRTSWTLISPGAGLIITVASFEADRLHRGLELGSGRDVDSPRRDLRPARRG
jgi:hypothetical protein